MVGQDWGRDMSDGTAIEWADATVNVINGCDVVSPGCKHCYAMKQAHRFPVRQGLTRKTAGGMVWTGEVRFHEPALQQVLRWRRPRKIFWNAHGDTFHKDVPDEWIDRCFAAMAATPQHIHQVLTKRPERMRRYCDRITSATGAGAICDQMVLLGFIEQARAFLPRQAELSHLPNVWLGVSVEDQLRADERIPILLDTPAAIRWLSMEPLLGQVDLSRFLQAVHHHPANRNRDSEAMMALIKAARDRMGGGIDWVVLGGESGPKARPMDPRWARAIRDQCAAAGVPFLFKQWGEWGHPRPPIRMQGDPPGTFRKIPRGFIGEREVKVHQFRDGSSVLKVGKKAAGRQLDGIEHNGFPL